MRPTLSSFVIGTLAAFVGMGSAGHAQVLVPPPGARPVDIVKQAADRAARADSVDSTGRAVRPKPTPAAIALWVSRDSTTWTKRRLSAQSGLRRLWTALVNNGEWCNPPRADTVRAAPIQWCHFYSSSQEAAKAAETFWNGTIATGSDVTFAQMVNVVAGDKAQSTKVELLSDFWNTMRVSFSGVLATKSSPDGSSATKPSNDGATQSKAQQFLNGGGPASFKLERPFVVANLIGSNTVVLGQANTSFLASAAGKDSPADSMQFASTGLRIQSQIDGGLHQISGIANLTVDRVYGGRAFYRAATADSTRRTGFGAASFSIGLVLDRSVQLTWNKIFFGPRNLQHGANFISVNVTRLPSLHASN